MVQQRPDALQPVCGSPPLKEEDGPVREEVFVPLLQGSVGPQPVRVKPQCIPVCAALPQGIRSFRLAPAVLLQLALQPAEIFCEMRGIERDFSASSSALFSLLHPSISPGAQSNTLAISSMREYGMFSIFPVSYLNMVCFVVPTSFPSSSCVSPLLSLSTLILSPVVFMLPPRMIIYIKI